MIRQILLCVCLSLLWTPRSFAEITLIARKTDGVVCGVVYPPQSVVVELQNVLRSECGGVAADYTTTVISDAQWAAKGTQFMQVLPNGQVRLVDNPRIVQQQQRQQQQRTLMQQKLRLTPEEFDELREALR